MNVVGLAPGGHDPGVVAGNDDDLVDALGLELRDLADVAGDVADLARGGEGAGEGDEDDLFVLELCSGIHVSGPSLCVQRIELCECCEADAG